MSSITLKTRNQLPEEGAIAAKAKKEHQKLLEQLLKVDYQESNRDATFSRVRELRHDTTEAKASLGLTEFALDGIAISFIFTLLLEHLWFWISRSSTQRRTTLA